MSKRDRPARRRRAASHERRRRLRRHLLQRRGKLPEDSFANMREFAQAARLPVPLPSGRDARRSRAPMARSARPTSLASTATSGSDIAAASTKAARRRPLPARAGSFSKPCAPSLLAAPRRLIKSPRSAARSNGRPGGGDRRRARPRGLSAAATARYARYRAVLSWVGSQRKPVHAHCCRQSRSR